MDKCVFCKQPIGLLQERILINWRKRKGERRIVIAYSCTDCGEDRTTDFCQPERPVFK